MFAFFKSKKPSPTQTTVEPIPGPATKEDDFIFIERRDSSPKGPTPQNDDASTVATTAATSPVIGGLYPTIAEPLPNDATTNSGTARQTSDEWVGYALHGVPFRLSSDLTRSTDTDITRIQVDEILSYSGRIQYAPSYDFIVERSVLQD